MRTQKVDEIDARIQSYTIYRHLNKLCQVNEAEPLKVFQDAIQIIISENFKNYLRNLVHLFCEKLFFIKKIECSKLENL